MSRGVPASGCTARPALASTTTRATEEGRTTRASIPTVPVWRPPAPMFSIPRAPSPLRPSTAAHHA
eukprot:8062037-Alexandrium_andersonii.AAC.1